MNANITDTEQTILSEGFEQVMTTGVRSFTVESLAGRLGMSKKTIYKFWPSKERLILAIMMAMTQRVKRQFDRILRDEENAAIQFTKVMGVIGDTISRVSVDRLNELKIRYPKIWQYVEEFRRERMENMRTILTNGQAQGLVRHDVDIRSASILFSEIVNRVFQPEYFAQNEVSIRETLETFLEIFSRGIFTDEGISIIEEAS